ncbi:hypothetical protein AB4Z40_17785 [Bosea sp. 2YAB26]|uniref:hypothetical protein n=1 Tax=Bosea sp. 2YAB26 TaxID=3237478 RepID=UPI003F919D68
MTMRVLTFAAIAALALGSSAASSQTITTYQTGLRLAQKRGYANAECYAQVFARHAVVVEKASGNRGWFAPSTPAYNAELRRRCGVDRLADLAARKPARIAGRNTYAGPQTQGGAYLAGTKIAAQRGYSGDKVACFARVFAEHATFRPSPIRTGFVDWSANLGPAITGEMQSQCGISI